MVKRNRSIVIAITLLAGVLSLALLGGCGGGGGGSSDGSTQTGSITGRAYDSSTGLGVSSAAVSAGSIQTTTASDGRFTLNNVPVGSVNLVVSKPSQSLTGQVTVSVVAGATTQVDVPLLDSGPPPPPL